VKVGEADLLVDFGLVKLPFHVAMLAALIPVLFFVLIPIMAHDKEKLICRVKINVNVRVKLISALLLS